MPERIGLVVCLEDPERIDSALGSVSIVMTAGGRADPSASVSRETLKINDDADVGSGSCFPFASRLTQELKKSMKDPKTCSQALSPPLGGGPGSSNFAEPCGGWRSSEVRFASASRASLSVEPVATRCRGAPLDRSKVLPFSDAALLLMGTTEDGMSPSYKSTGVLLERVLSTVGEQEKKRDRLIENDAKT